MEMKHRPRPAAAQAGSSLLELQIAMTVLLFGLVSISGLIGMAVVTAAHAKEQSQANQMAREAVESVYSARIMGMLQFSQVRNVSGGGIFLDGYQPIKQLGPDGLVNTADDLSALALTYVDPGKDALYSTADDRIVTFAHFERQVQITDVNAALRRITVNVRYTVNSQSHVISMSTLISQIN